MFLLKQLNILSFELMTNVSILTQSIGGKLFNRFFSDIRSNLLESYIGQPLPAENPYDIDLIFKFDDISLDFILK